MVDAPCLDQIWDGWKDPPDVGQVEGTPNKKHQELAPLRASRTGSLTMPGSPVGPF